MDQILLVVQGLVALALVGTILMQRSEGGALGIGGGPGGMMSARGAGNFLTRATTFLAVIFLGLCILLAVRSGIGRESTLMESFDANGAPLAEETQPGMPTIPDVPAEAMPGPDTSNLSGESAAPMSMEDAMEAIDPNALVVPPVPDDIPGEE